MYISNVHIVPKWNAINDRETSDHQKGSVNINPQTLG